MTRAKLPTMKNILRETNPAERWLEGRFQTDLRMADGHHIVVRFDLQSTGLTGYRFDAEKVIAQFGEHILVDKIDYGEYDVASAIALVLNERMDAVAMTVIEQCRMSLSLLDALDSQDYDTARLIAYRLSDSLLSLGGQVDSIWGEWLLRVAAYLNYA